MGKGSGTGGSAGGGVCTAQRHHPHPSVLPFCFLPPHSSEHLPSHPGDPMEKKNPYLLKGVEGNVSDGYNRKMLHNLCWDSAGLLQPGQAGAEGPLRVCLFPI